MTAATAAMRPSPLTPLMAPAPGESGGEVGSPVGVGPEGVGTGTEGTSEAVGAGPSSAEEQQC